MKEMLTDENMKKELIRQIKPFLGFGLPSWGLAFLSGFFVNKEQKGFIWLFIPVFIMVLFAFSLNSVKFATRYKELNPIKPGIRQYPHFVKDDDLLNKYYAISIRWFLIFFGIIYIYILTASPEVIFEWRFHLFILLFLIWPLIPSFCANKNKKDTST